MPTQLHKVGLVVDRDCGEQIAKLARSFHVWVVESPTNTPVIQRFWELEQADPDSDPLDSGITSFKASETESAQEMCARIAGDVDDHHGELAHDRAWSEIVVYGVSVDDRLRHVFEDLGATEISPTPGGFLCRR